MPLSQWDHEDDLEAFLQEKGSGFIFKHSTRCGVSSEALREVQKLLDGQADIPVFCVLVIENRATSNAVSESLGVVHASPQIILLREGKMAWQASHWEITADHLAEAWAAEKA